MSHHSPLERLDQAIGKRVWVLLKGEKEIEGDLVGVDDLVNMVMENVIELTFDASTGTSKETGRVKELLLNGNNVVMIVEGGRE